jgi:hypothetical protein
MLIRLKEIWAHIDPTMDHVEVIRCSFKMTLQKVDPAQRKASIKKSDMGSNPKINVDKSTNIDTDTHINSSTNIDSKTNVDARTNIDSRTSESVQEASTLPQKSTQHLTESVKHRGTKRPTYYKRELDRALWERAQSRCEFIDEKTGRRCDCRFGLQREHVIPLALGGTNELSNMQLLCATHNQLRARKVFGDKKIDSYFNY